jgi:hypothetical protein
VGNVIYGETGLLCPYIANAWSSWILIFCPNTS